MLSSTTLLYSEFKVNDCPMLLMDLIVEVQKTSMYTGLSKVAGCPRKLLPT